MMGHNDQYMVLGGLAKQRCPHRHTGSDIETTAQHLECARPRLSRVDLLDLQDNRIRGYCARSEWLDHLVPHTVDVGIDGPQDVVAREDVPERQDERVDVEFTLEADDHRHIVRSGIRVETVQKPHPLLGQRQWRWCVAVASGLHRLPSEQTALQRAACIRAGSPLVLDSHSECVDAGSLEQSAEGNLDAECHPESRDHPGCNQRVAAEGEEVVVQPDAFHTEQSSERFGDHLFDRGRRWTEGTNPHRRLGKCASVELAVGSERESVHDHDRGGHHVVR